MSLARQSWPTQSTFATIFGERAPGAWKTEHEVEIDAAVEGHADAIMQLPDGTFTAADQKHLAPAAMQKRLPFFTGGRPAVVDGGLLTTTSGNNQPIRIATTMVDRVLKGAKPGDLAVAAPIVDQLMINTRTAKALGLTIPPSVLARATELLP